MDIIFVADSHSGRSGRFGIQRHRFTGTYRRSHLLYQQTGNDHVGNIILNFGARTIFPQNRVNVATTGNPRITRLNNRSDAEYIFYKDYPKQRLDVEYPQIQETTSLYGLISKPRIATRYWNCWNAHDMHAIIYYDPNFRCPIREASKLSHHHRESGIRANIVRGSQEDFFYMWGLQADKMQDKVKFCTATSSAAGAEQVSLRTGTISKNTPFSVGSGQHHLHGAGDNY